MFSGNRGAGAPAGGRPSFAPRALLLAVAAGALAFGMLAPAPQAQVNPFGRNPGGLTTEQGDAMGKAIEAALAADKVGTTETWSAGGAGGTVTVQKLYQKNGLSCVLLKHSFTDDDRTPYSLPFCNTDKGWKVYF